MNTLDRLHELIVRIDSQPLRDTCETLLTDAAFLKAPASVKFHHAYTGGLAIHTVEVAEIALRIALSANTLIHPTPDEDVLITAALWHDYCKIHEYTEYPEPGKWDYATGNKFRDRIGHITGSVFAFYQCADESGNSLQIPQSIYEAITHCILAHHGPVREWGSPVAPQTIEALILHQADMLSAKFGATK